MPLFAWRPRRNAGVVATWSLGCEWRFCDPAHIEYSVIGVQPRRFGRPWEETGHDRRTASTLLLGRPYRVGDSSLFDTGDARARSRREGVALHLSSHRFRRAGPQRRG